MNTWKKMRCVSTWIRKHGVYLNWICRFISFCCHSHPNKTMFDRACARWLLGYTILSVCVIAWSWNAVGTLSYDKLQCKTVWIRSLFHRRTSEHGLEIFSLVLHTNTSPCAYGMRVRAWTFFSSFLFVVCSCELVSSIRVYYIFVELVHCYIRLSYLCCHSVIRVFVRFTGVQRYQRSLTHITLFRGSSVVQMNWKPLSQFIYSVWNERLLAQRPRIVTFCLFIWCFFLSKCFLVGRGVNIKNELIKK